MNTTWRWLAVALVAASTCWIGARACMCTLLHPQQHYCGANFVVLARVKGVASEDRFTKAYDVFIRKEYKVNDVARPALKQRRIWSPRDDSVCGVALKPGYYLVAGHVQNGQAWVSLCDFAKEWSKISAKQRKGFRLLYQHGCKCDVRHRWSVMGSAKANPTVGNCSWSTAWKAREDCQGLHSVCVPQKGRCSWLSSASYRQCMKQNREQYTWEP